MDKDFLKPCSRSPWACQNKNDNLNQILLIDKPVGWTSFDVVAKIRGVLSKKEGKRIKVGHSGTLDPFATGLLIILCGDATKNQDSFMKLDKEYEASLKLGYTSTTGDPEGEITPFVSLPTNQIYNKLIGNPEDEKIDSRLRGNDKIVSTNEKNIIQKRPLDTQKLARDDIEKTLKKFIGETKQTPPAFSAIKINGERAYKLARLGKEVKIKPRVITIYDIKIISYKYPELKIKVKCSSGTYIRTLAEDIGKDLDCGAYLTELRRTKIGDYDISNSKTIENIDIKL